MSVTIRRLDSRDAQSLKRCFENCYGDTYPNDLFYDIEALSSRVESGKLLSVAAFSDANELIGHTGLTIIDESALIPEAGNTVVDPAYRGGGILGRLANSLSILCTDTGHCGYVHYPTAAHAVMQKYSIAAGGVETGVMLDYIPAETRYAKMEQPPGRIAATIAYQPLGKLPPLAVYIPPQYSDLLNLIYVACKLPRERKDPSRDDHVAISSNSVVRKTINRRRKLASVIVDTIGADLGDQLKEIQQKDPTHLIHVELGMDDPLIGYAVELLRAQNFFFAGVIPHFRHTDILRLQRCAQLSQTTTSPELVNPMANTILSWINNHELNS